MDQIMKHEDTFDENNIRDFIDLYMCQGTTRMMYSQKATCVK